MVNLLSRDRTAMSADELNTIVDSPNPEIDTAAWWTLIWSWLARRGVMKLSWDPKSKKNTVWFIYACVASGVHNYSRKQNLDGWSSIVRCKPSAHVGRWAAIGAKCNSEWCFCWQWLQCPERNCSKPLPFQIQFRHWFKRLAFLWRKHRDRFMYNGHFTIWCFLESQKVQNCCLLLQVTMKELRFYLWELRLDWRLAGTVALLRFTSMWHILSRIADISAQLVRWQGFLLSFLSAMVEFAWDNMNE